MDEFEIYSTMFPKRHLTLQEEDVLLRKATEHPFTGEYCDFWHDGTYYCRQCGAPLYRSDDKFEGGCGWPSFDDEIPGAIRRQPDKDGRRTEIVCANCGGHLGHVFKGEGFTPKNLRHCVNSLSIQFEPNTQPNEETPQTRPSRSDSLVETAYLAGGCFWGMEYMFSKKEGVIDVTTGYMGGKVDKPTYEEVYQDNTGHFETVKVHYDRHLISYEQILKFFFEIHDPTQQDGQGPDIGTRYQSAIFYFSETQKETAIKVIEELRKKGYDVATKLIHASRFYPAEDYHQHYYQRQGGEPYCHIYQKRF